MLVALYSLIYALSGFAFLSAEIILIREMGLRTGSTPLSAAWILSVFFLFAAIGAKLGGRWASDQAASARRYGWVELGIGASLLLIFLMRDVVFQVMFFGQPWEYAYAVYLAAIPSLLSGMTLPLLGGALTSQQALGKRSRRAGLLYGTNLFGAALGIPIGGVYLPWKFGYSITVWVLFGLLMLVAAGAIIASRWLRAEAVEKVVSKAPESEVVRQPAIWVAMVMVFSGVLTLATEIIAIGYFQVIAEESIYSYSAVFLVFILGLALGALVAVVWRPPLVAVLTATAVLLMTTPLLLQLVFNHRDRLPAEQEMTYYARLILVAGCALLPLLSMQGAVFPLAWRWLRQHQSSSLALGHFLFLNKLGSAAGVLIAGYCLVRYLGFVGAFLVLGALYGALALLGAWYTTNARRQLSLSGSVLGLALALGWWFGQPPIGLESDEELLAAYYGKSDLVTVVEGNDSSRHIRINQAYTLNGTQRALMTQQMEGWLPCVLNANPQRVLFIGMASGISAKAVLDFPVESITAVELSPEVVRAARDNFADWNAELFSDARAEIVVDDGRHVLSQANDWNLVICDLFNPIRAGTSQLYSREFFSQARDHLSPDGQMVVWLAAYQFDAEMMASVMRSFAESFDYAIVLRANFDPLQPVIGLMGAHKRIDLSKGYLAEQLAVLPDIIRVSDPVMLRSVANLQLTYMGDLHDTQLPSYLADYPMNTDDFPYVAFLGPREFGPGELLRGINLLKWGADLFMAQSTPSVDFGHLSLESIAAVQSAGNHYFAAATMSISPPGMTLEKEQGRQMSYYNHLRTAMMLWPDVQVSPDDLVK